MTTETPANRTREYAAQLSARAGIDHTPGTSGPDDVAAMHANEIHFNDPTREIAPGVFELTDPHKVYAVPSTSTDRIHQVTVNTRTGAMRCDGPWCHDRTCSHQKRVRAARAGF